MRAARKFEPEIVRAGGVPSRVSFSLQCSSCQNPDTISGTSKLPDDVVEKKFKQRGWLLGRSRAHDICPACIRLSQKNRLADKFKVTENGEAVPDTVAFVEAAGARRAENTANTSAILQKYFGPKTASNKTPPGDDANSEAPGMAAAPGPDLSQINEQLDHIRAAGELNVELLDKIVTAQGQQITALERLTTTLARQNESIINALCSLERAVTRLSDAKPKAESAPEPKPERAPLPDALLLLPPGFGKSASEPKPESKQLPLPITQAVEPPAKPCEAKLAAKAAPKAAPKMTDSVRVASYPEGAQMRSSIRVDRTVWEEAGLKDRVTITRTDNEIVFKRDVNGIKIKKINTQSVYLQTKKLGDIDFEVSQIFKKKGELRVVF